MIEYENGTIKQLYPKKGNFTSYKGYSAGNFDNYFKNGINYNYSSNLFSKENPRQIEYDGVLRTEYDLIGSKNITDIKLNKTNMLINVNTTVTSALFYNDVAFYKPLNKFVENDENSTPNYTALHNNSTIITNFGFKDILFQPIFDVLEFVDNMATTTTRKYLSDLTDTDIVKSVQITDYLYNYDTNLYESLKGIEPVFLFESGLTSVATFLQSTRFMRDTSSSQNLFFGWQNTRADFLHDYISTNNFQTVGIPTPPTNKIIFTKNVNTNYYKLSSNDTTASVAKYDGVTYQQNRYLYKMATGKYCKQILASLGLYMVCADIPNFNTHIKIDNLETNVNIWLGEMLNNGNTTGKFLKGSEIANSNTINKNGSTKDYIFTPTENINFDKKLDDNTLNLIPSISNFLHWYAISQSDMIDLLAKFNSDDVPAGFTPLDNIVGLYQLPFDIPAYSNGENVEIIMGGSTKFRTGVNGYLLTNQTNHNVITMSIPFKISENYQNYLDYEPFRELTLYLPYANCIKLPTSLFMNENLSITAIYDIFSGEITYYIFINNTLYTAISGNFSVMQPLTAENVGQQKQLLINGIVGTLTSVGGAVGSAISNNAFGLVASGINAVSNISNLYSGLNFITPTSKTVTCGNTTLYQPTAIYLYDSYTPLLTNNVNNSTFYKTQISNCSGFTQTLNAEISISNKNHENMLKNIMNTGFYI